MWLGNFPKGSGLMSNSSILSLANFTGFGGRCGRLFVAPSKWYWKLRSSSTSTPDNMSQERISSAANDLRVMRTVCIRKHPSVQVGLSDGINPVFPGMVKVETVNLR
jgi:hypothetical protein